MTSSHSETSKDFGHFGDVAWKDGRQSERALEIRRGTGRLLSRWKFVWVPELTLSSGRRADLVALGPKSEIWIVEIKSSVQDFISDGKWQEYRPFCDRLYFATLPSVPMDIFPENAGLIVADAHGGEFVRETEDHKLAASTRKKVMLQFAQHSARMLQALNDPLNDQQSVD